MFRKEVREKPACDHTTLVRVNGEEVRRSTIIEDGMCVCTQCGTIVRSIYVTRYRHNASPLYIYNRVSRFALALHKYKIRGDQMCTVFEGIETVWKKHRPRKRRYFLNIRFCVWHIGIIFGHHMAAKHGPCIKDPARIESQRRIFKRLLKKYNKKYYDAYCAKSSTLSDTTKDAPDTNDC